MVEYIVAIDVTGARFSADAFLVIARSMATSSRGEGMLPSEPRRPFANWPRGPMDKASAYGAGGCRFESCRGHFVDQDTLEDRPRREESERPHCEVVSRTKKVKETTPSMFLLRKPSGKP